MLPRECSGPEGLLCPHLSCLPLCVGSSLAPSAPTLSFSLPGKKEAFEVAEGKLIPHRGLSSLPVKLRFMQLIFTLIHLSTGSLPCTLPPFLFFLCQSLCLIFFPPISASFFVNLSWQVIALITTCISRTYGPSSKWAALVLSINRLSKNG